MNNRDQQLIYKILSEVAVIRQLLDGFTQERFVQDERTFRAVCMTLINIGELVKNLTEPLKQAHPEVAWRAVAGMRDITAHKYQTLHKEDVYKTCVEDVPRLGDQMQSILSQQAPNKSNNH